MKTVVGFDVSSSTIGWAALTIDAQNNITKKESGYIKPLKTKDLIYNIADTRDKINTIINKHKPDYIGVEEIIKFMKGKSTANTVVMLTAFNRMVCLAAYDYLKKSPTLFNVMSIRHGLKLEKKPPKKEDIPDLVAHHLKYDFKYSYNRNDKKRDENYDEADGIAVSLFFCFLLTGKKVNKNIKVDKLD